MHEYGRRSPGDTVLWNGRRYLTKNVIRGTEGVMWYLAELGTHNPGFGDMGAVAESELVPVMPQADRDSLAGVQQNILRNRERLLQAAHNRASSAAAIYSWKALLRDYHSVSKSLCERFPFDDFAKSCYEQAEAWINE